MTQIKAIYEELILRFGNSLSVAADKWEIISSAHNSSSRFYHDLTHLESMFIELEKVKGQIIDWDSIMFSLFYHDIIYDSSKLNNEEKSAEFAKDQLLSLNINAKQIEKIQQIILATKTHIPQNDSDINIFLDADLSIFGAEKRIYEMYSENIRLEYLEYPSFVFNQGRINILEQFLNQETIYKSDFFKRNLEKKANYNLNNELKKLKGMNQAFSRSDTNEFVQYLEFDGDLSEFFYNSAKILDQAENVEKTNYYPGWFDSGYYRFKYKGSSLHLEYDGMLGILLRTEPNITEVEKSNAKEIFEKLLSVRLTSEDLERVRKFYTNKKNRQSSRRLRQ